MICIFFSNLLSFFQIRAYNYSEVLFMKIKQFLFKTVFPTLLITGTVLLAVSPIGCKVSEEGIQLLAGDFSVPHITSVAVTSDTTVCLCFDKQVHDATATITAKSSEDSFTATCSFLQEEKQNIYTLNKKMQPGAMYILDGSITDQNGNTLTYSIPFAGYNAFVPDIVLSEIRNAYSTTTDSSTQEKKYKCEFIELYALSDGNLAGLELVSAGDGEEKKYEFPAITVKKGEYIVVHLRKMENGCIDETGTDLTCSTATDSCETARDLWIDNTKARLSQTDIIMLRNANNNSVIDAVVFAQSAITSWKTDFEPFSAAVKSSGVWLDAEGNASCAISSAICSDSLTSSAATRTLSRQNVLLLAQEYSPVKKANNASVWIITANKGSGSAKIPGDTPGRPNSDNAYTEK